MFPAGEKGFILPPMPAVGDRFGQYELLATLGAGGMGTVFRARHVELAREVALKVLHGAAAAHDAFRARFTREMRLMTRMEHSGLVRILDAGDVDGAPFLAMELLEGRSLIQVLAERGRLPPGEVLSIGARVADALAHLHARDILHRDLSLGNVFVTAGGAVKLLDFGLARSVDSTALTEPGTVMGTTIFIAPEVIVRGAYSTASDLWSLGVLLRTLATGHAVFDAPMRVELYGQIMNRPIPPIATLVPAFAPAQAELLDSLLERDLGRRCPSAAHFRDRAQARRTIKSVAPAKARGRAAPVLLGAALVLAAGAWWAWPRAPRPAASPAASPAVPAPSAASPAPAASVSPLRPLLPRWREIEDLADRLRSPGEVGRRAVRDARARTGVAIDKASVWSWWMELGRWLARPAAGFEPPAPPGAAADAELYSEAHFEMMWRAQTPLERFALGMAWTHDTPRDGRAWLYLGEAAESGGSPAADVARLYAIGLERRVAKLPDSLWITGRALARAAIVLRVKPGHVCVDWIEENEEDRQSWDYFAAALDGIELDKQAQVLLWLLDRPAWADRAARALVAMVGRRVPADRRASVLAGYLRQKPGNAALARAIPLPVEKR